MTGTIDHLRLDDLSIAYQRIGSGDRAPLVFLHGLGDSAIMTFAPIARHPLLARYTSVMIDLPGFGYSTAPRDWAGTIEQHAEAVAKAFEALDIRNAIIVGHSMGGSVALLLAPRIPERVSALILAEPLLVREQSQLAASIARRSEDEFVMRGYGMLQRATRRQAARGEAAALSFLAPLERADPAILHRSSVSLLADRTPSFRDLLAGIGIPRTILIGERTSANTTLIPDDVTVVRVSHAGHSMMSENPDAFAGSIAAAIARLWRENGERRGMMRAAKGEPAREGDANREVPE